ncbi:MAG: MGMT family protein [Trueperaceae bacterium]|nr:MGMT family protein [Trueperaceae bacterium]
MVQAVLKFPPCVPSATPSARWSARCRPGRVTTYGQVALWAGRPGAARQVGAALRGLARQDPNFPWQRVINARGGISTYRVGAGELQEALLRREGVEVRDGRVDLRRYAFWPGQPG